MPDNKTFVNGAVLTANDLNIYVNPSTAKHVASAVAAGVISNNQVSGTTSVQITFPSGRFAKPPVVVAQYAAGAAAGTQGLVVSVSGITATGFTLSFVPPGNQSYWQLAQWIAVTMD